jgi:hypothetical protein
MPRPQQRPPTVMTQTSVNPLPRGFNTSGMPVTDVSGRMGQSGGGSDPLRKFAGSTAGQLVGDGLTSFGLGLMGGKDWQEGLAMGGQHFAETGQQRRTERKDAQTEGQVKTWLQANFPDLATLPVAVAVPLAQARFEAGLKPGPGPTALMQNLAAAGLVPGSPEYEAAILKGIDQGTTVNVGEGSSAYNRAIDEGFAKTYMDLQGQGRAAQGALGSFDLMEQALADPNIYTGAAGDQVLGLKRLGQMVGLDPEGITSAETFNSLSKQAALQVMGGSLGTGFSNADRDFVMDQVPNMGNSIDGNKALVGVQRKIAGRKIEIAQFATQYAQQHGQLDAGFDQALREWAEANPLFPAEAPAAAPASSGGYAEGTVIENPTTGARMVMRGGQWVGM